FAATSVGVLLVVVGLVDVEVEVQSLFFSQRQVVVDVAVVLFPVIFHIGGVERCAQIISERVGGTHDVGILQALFAFAIDVIAAGASLAAQCSEATSAQLQAVDFVADQVSTGSDFRQDAAVVGGEYGAGNELVTVF